MPYTTNDGNEIYYETAGTGPAILFVSGLGADRSVWYRQKAAFAETHTVITFDNRGIGKSTSCKGGYSLENMARDAAAVLRAAQDGRDDPAYLAGVSMGGTIAAALAALEPQLARGLFVISSSLFSAASTEMALARALEVLDREGGAAFASAMSALVFTAKFARERARDLAAIERAWAPLVEKYPEIRRQVAAIKSFDGLLRGAITCPVEAIAGRNDRLIPLEAMERTARLLGTQLRIVNGIGHGLLIERPQAINAALEVFFGK